MTTPSGIISASDINIELGKTTTASMALNDSDVRTLAGVASGTISYNDLRNKSAVQIFLQDDEYYAYQSYSGSTCQLRVGSDGYIKSGFNFVYTNRYTWCNPTTAAGDYEVFASLVTSSSGATGTFGAWLDCSTNPTWQVLDATSGGTSEWATIDIQIRKKSTINTLASARIFIEAERLF